MAPVITRRLHDLTRCPHDGLTKGKVDKRIQTNRSHRKTFRQFGHAKDLPSFMKLLPEPEKSTSGHTMAQDVRTNGPMFSRSEPILNIPFIVFHSGLCDACISTYRKYERPLRAVVWKSNGWQ